MMVARELHRTPKPDSDSDEIGVGVGIEKNSLLKNKHKFDIIDYRWKENLNRYVLLLQF